MVITYSQNIAPHNAISTVGTEMASTIQGRYGHEAVKQISHHTIQQHPHSFAALVGSQMMTLRRDTNLKDLIDRMRTNPNTILSAQSGFSTALSEMPPYDHRLLHTVFQFLSGLQGRAWLPEDDDEEAEAEFDEDQLNPQQQRRIARQQGREDGGAGGRRRSQEHYERTILSALEGMQSAEAKAATLSVARGYFDGAEGIDLNFISALDQISERFEQTVTLPPEGEDGALATLETNPLAVRSEFRRKLRDSANLGTLFEELVELGIESKLLEDIGREMAGLVHASDKNYVRALTRELSRIWQFKSCYQEAKDVTTQIAPHVRYAERRPEPIELTAKMLNFCSKSTVNQGDTQALLGPLQNGSFQSQVVYSNCLRDMHTRLPDSIWPSLKDRNIQYSALRVLCDRLAEAEERAYAEATAASR